MLQRALQTDIHLFGTGDMQSDAFFSAPTREAWTTAFICISYIRFFRFGWIYFMETSNRYIQEPLPLKIWSCNSQTSGMRHRINFSRPRINFPRKIIKTENNWCVHKWKRSDKTVEGKKWREKGNLGLLGLKVSFLITRYSVYIPFCCTLSQNAMHVRI